MGCSMSLEDLEEIVSRLVSDNIKINSYISSLRNVDTAISDVIIDNKYSNIIGMQFDFVLEKFLGRELYEWVMWYVYELPVTKQSEEPNAWVNDVAYTITDIESFMNFAQHGLKVPMLPKHQQ